MITLSIAVLLGLVPQRVDPHAARRLAAGSVTLGLPLATGAFGSVHFAQGPDGTSLIAKRAARKKPNAEQYLDIEAEFNSKKAKYLDEL